ncbi:aminopeptidase [Flavobacterium enshiense]|uniref:aminopeptidase n=1 Tax=Flavobacterium enshiense TaxID=1341165 RepID=UPI00345D9288
MHTRMFFKILFQLLFLFLLPLYNVSAQQKISIKAHLDTENKLINVEEQISFTNTSSQSLNTIVLNDWNNAYSGNDTPLGRRFSDEFVRSYLLAKDMDRGSTSLLSVVDSENQSINFIRPDKNPDLIEILPKKPILPNQSFSFTVSYTLKIPNDKFTRYGFNSDNIFVLKNWFLTVARLEENGFVKYSNENLDDIANSETDYDVAFELGKKYHIFTDLNVDRKTENENSRTHYLSGKKRLDFDLTAEIKPTYHNYKNELGEVVTNLRDRRLNEIQKAMVIDKITNFVAAEMGSPKHEKIIISQVDYDRNPFYGLNQLPAFLSPFPDHFLYEIKFLKVYTDKHLKTTLHLNHRKETWIYDAFQSFIIMKYIKDNYPEMKMMGNLSDFKLLKGFNIFKADFNDQFTYVYLLMARKNLDQAVGDEKDTFIKFNEQISGKYRAGLSLNYLDHYLGNDLVLQSIKEFTALNQLRPTQEADFEKILKSKTTKNIDWFFQTVIHSRNLIDFKITKVRAKNEFLDVTIKNKTKTNVPVSLYGLKNDSIVSKHWIENITSDTLITIPKNDAEKLILNYHKEIPEYNTRNNWSSLKSFFGNNRPFKFTFIKDLEDSKKNQVFYVPEFSYNLYDGVSPGLSLHNKSFLDKPFIFDITPVYSSKTKQLIGGAFFTVNQNIREDRLYNIRYSLGGNTYHYAPDAAYMKITPSISFRFRDLDYRLNKKEFVTIRHIFLNREKSDYVTVKDENYSVFNLRYSQIKSEISNSYNFMTDAQIAGNFGKLSGEVQYRKLFNNNQQVNLRFFAGTFIYKSTSSDFFNFGLDRPTDYLFDYGLLGRSESTGLFSQQYIMAEGGFKSKFQNRLANQWMTTVNGSFSIWNWVEIYGDAGFMKNNAQKAEFLYDSGIRLNLVPDYFELYFPVYSKNGWEIAENKYEEKIRFVITISPKTLISLFTRKWL